MKYRQIEAFHALMISGSTVRAAEIMGITQPAVSRLIAELEHAVRFALFDRVRGRLVATPEAHLFFREVDESFRGLDRLRASAAAIRDYGEGNLRIGCFAAGSVSLVPAAIRAFRIKHPAIRLTFHVKSSADIRNGVVDGQYDIGLAADEIDRAGVDTQVFGSYAGVIAMPGDHPLARHEVLEPAHLKGVPLLGLVAEDRARQRLDALLGAEGIVPDYVLETPNSATICALAEEGNAVGLVNPMVIADFRSRGLTFRPFAPKVMFRSLLLYPANTQKSRLVLEFCKALLSQR
ncbi:LysR substrate-binding domain-containing protein [Nitratireductor sp. ZSWI3]|uniref:LysR substrate-binding domain-containing protein n=1 Tax=Nitratireductor sp. ZSWI3 TaxID=2966359 RepID=UPI00215005A3|nr:LysR substrate-binding domain-containing protein [Nitratireductor sp. ZSWI3]MCR4264760.1 LysR substrate-binding domain-containing protein [Nitratireductor sp. ZSWI3]